MCESPPSSHQAFPPGLLYEDILPHYLAIGVAYERFMDSCPKELEPYDKAYKMQIVEQDNLQHMWWGNYGISALIVAIDRCFGGKKSKAEYIKEPILSKTFKSDGLTEEEKQKQRELFVAKLQVMQTNFELSKKGQ